MAECNTVVEVYFADNIQTLQSKELTLRTISFEISNDQLKQFRDIAKTDLIGLQVILKFKCYNRNIEINNNTYPAKCISLIRVTISKFLLRFQFTKLNGAQKREIIRSLARLY